MNRTVGMSDTLDTLGDDIEKAMRGAHQIGKRDGVLCAARYLRTKGALDMAMALVLHIDSISEETEDEQ